jgi:hypothetical protein
MSRITRVTRRMRGADFGDVLTVTL